MRSWGSSKRSQCKCLLQHAEIEAKVLWEDRKGARPQNGCCLVPETVLLWLEANELEVLLWREEDERSFSCQAMDWSKGSIRCWVCLRPTRKCSRRSERKCQALLAWWEPAPRSSRAHGITWNWSLLVAEMLEGVKGRHKILLNV